MSSLLGKILANRYRIDSFLGRGGMAEVYKVWDSRRMTFLAMKVLYEDLAIDRVFMRRFKREAQTLERLQHPNIVRFYGLEQEGPHAFMLLDFVEGKTLKRAIFDAGEPLPDEQIRFIMRSVCGALQFAHSEGLAHCDIKPANIMLHQNGTVLLADFGIARVTDAATATMVGAGTPAYMAPEQVRGLDPTPQSDIYSLGVVLYEMLTGGERPFTGETATITGSTGEKLRWEQMNARPTPPSQWNPNLPPELEAVVLKCLEKDPKRRYKSALDLFNALELATGTLKADAESAERPRPEPAPLVETPAPPPPTPKPTPKPDRSLRSTPPASKEQRPVRFPEKTAKKQWLGLAGIALLLLTLGIGWLMGGGSAKVFPTKTPTATFTPVFTPTPTITPTPILGVGSTQISEKDGMTMLYIPAGEFQMGSEDGDSDESPVHSVYLDSYWIDQTEVTNAMYAEFLNAEGNQSEGGVSWLDANDDDVLIVKNGATWQPISGYENHPVVEVSWYGAQAYCEWADRRLPTEAEWEKAARGGLVGKAYPWGDEFDCHKANADDETIEDDYVVPGGKNCDGYNRTAPVGSFSTNGYGLYDMAGNVWEWTADWYDSDYYANSPRRYPSGPNSGKYRVLRGGSWYNINLSLRAANRYRLNPDNTDLNIGFRCSLSLP